MSFRKKKKIGKSENMPWNILEDDTSCQAAERNPERGFEAITLQSTESHLPGTEETHYLTRGCLILLHLHILI